LRFTLHVQKLDDPYRVAYNRILKHYGPGCYPQEAREEEAHWSVPIGVHIPSRVADEKTETERVFTFNLTHVGELLIRKSTMTIERAPSLASIGRSILQRRAEIRQAVEKDLIKVLGEPEAKVRFGALKFAQTGLQPIYRTINRLLLQDYPTYWEIEDSGRHYLEQVDLVVRLGYANYTNEQPPKLVPTNKLTELYSQIRDIEETTDALLGLVLANYYYELLKDMRIAQFVPYVRASTSYYGDAIQFGRLISISKRRLRDNVREYYRGAPMPTRVRFAYPTIIRELVDANILEYDGDYISGKETIFEKLINLRSTFPMNEQPYGL
jgi:hypothetical protein